MRLLPVVMLLYALPVGAAEERMTPLVRAVQIARSSVVNIHSEKSRRGSDDVFSGSKDRKVSGMGTGIVVDERGYIVTNHHVVHEVDALEVSLNDGSRYSARVVTIDKPRDLAIIKVSPRRKLKVMPLGTSSDLMLAETVFAVGNAYGYEHTVTSGIVSALGRDVEVNETQSYYNLIQTDASINPGNSGGPLLNLNGEVIGINVAIRANAQRIGFAIPIDDARKVIARMMSAERLFGITAGLVTRDIKKAAIRKVVVDRVSSGSATSGITTGDEITRVDGIVVQDSVDVSRALFDHRPGDVVKVELKRNGQLIQTQVQLSKANSSQVARKTSPRTRTVSRPVETTGTGRAWKILGLKLSTLSSGEIASLAPEYRGGMRVSAVRQGGPAATKGIQKGDYLVGLHIWETLNDKDMAYILEDARISQHNPMTFYVVRKGKTRFGRLTLPTARR
jgi:serine protease Do